MLELKNKTALITGASRGIGYQMAVYLAQRGCHLILHSRKTDHLKNVMEKCQSFEIDIFCVAADLCNIDEVDLMLDKIELFERPVDLLFNNAGLQVGYRTDYWHTPVDDFATSFAVNTIAPARICHRLMPLMIERGFGRVINTTSGIKHQPQQAGYSASKAALDKISFDLGHDVDGTDVMVTVVDPGWCKTDLGGENAPNTPESALPGMVIGACLDDCRSPRYISAQDFSGMDLEKAVERVQKSDQYIVL